MRSKLAHILFPIAALLGAAAGGLHAATIENTATMRFAVGGGERTVTSNTTTVMTELPPTPAKLTFLRYTPGGGGGTTNTSADGGQCRNGAGFTSIDLPNMPAGLDLASAPLAPTRTFRGGDIVFISLQDGNRNLDPLTEELIEVRVTTNSGDEEILRLRETGPDTATFVAPIATLPIPPAAVKMDCHLSVGNGTDISASYVDAFYPTDIGTAEALIDPFGYVFSTEDGAPINGATVTLLNSSGQPTEAFGDDGLPEPYPTTVTSGGSVTTNIRTYQFPIGGFRFPLLRPGNYILRVTPPGGFRWPSTTAPRDLSLLVGPDGLTFTINPFDTDPNTPAGGSYGAPFPVFTPAPIKIDLPVDPLRGQLVLVKNASTGMASVGDFIRYEVTLTNRNRIVAQTGAFITDTLPEGLRYRAGSLNVNGEKVADPQISNDGRTLTVQLGTIPATQTRTVSYVTQVGPGTPLGEAVNEATATAEGGISASNRATVGVRITNGFFTDAFTIVGRVSEGQCGIDPKTRPGVTGIRLVMEDGTFVVTDENGQYHFEGVRPGTHVVQVDTSTIPEGYELVECIKNTRTAGRAFSQFVEGQGGSLWRADFVLKRKEGAAASPRVGQKPGAIAAKAVAAVPGEPVPATDGETATATAAEATTDTPGVESGLKTDAAGNIDWFADPTPAPALLYPKVDYNPRAPVTSVVLKHLPRQRVKLTVNGKIADPLFYEGLELSTDNSFAISSWRGLPLQDGENVIKAEVLSEGAPQVFERKIYYSNTATRATFVPERSKLVADGVTRPAIAVRITDRSGKPVRAGLTGPFKIRSPYTAATEVDLQQERQLAGLDRYETTWRVLGDDGIALIELQPTQQTGTAELEFEFTFDRQKRTDEVRAWLEPAARDWMVVGFVSGTYGFNTLAKNSERLTDTTKDKTIQDGQATLYAKGRVKGKWVLTLAYDSERSKRGLDGRRSLLRVIDPGRYYTVYGDRSQQGYDAASSEKLYLRLERPQFYALFGDYDTGLGESQLGAYSRTLTGGKAEFRNEKVAATAFIADTSLNFQRDEIQGNGLSGPYPLGRRDLILNTEKVRIETRDRFRSERIVDTKFLTRHIDYDIDYDAGTLLFREPILSRDRQFNPIFIVVEYETEGSAVTYMNGGARVAVEPIPGKVRLGVTAVRDEDGMGKSNLGAVDVRLRPTDKTEVRLEAALTDSKGAGTNEAYIAEVEHRGEKVDAVVYYRQQDTSFGVGQQNRAEGGTTKYGIDGRVQIATGLDANASAYRETYAGGVAERQAVNANVEYRNNNTSMRVGVLHTDDTNQTGEELTSTLLQLGASQRLLDGKLDVTADSDFSIGKGTPESIDYPARYRFGAAYALLPDVRLVARHEITDGEDFNAATTQFGIDASPWGGSRLTTTLNQQQIGENGERSFANLGLSQSLLLNKNWGVDLSVDSAQTFSGGVDAADVLNVYHPIASGGQLSGNQVAASRLVDDFIAFSGGATYRSELWSWNGRFEYRDADSGDQYGVQMSLLRQIENGISLSLATRAFRFDQDDGSRTTAVNTEASVAWRPIGSRWSILDKLEVRMDKVEGGVVGGYNPFGNSGLSVSGDAKSWRIVNNLALNRVSGAWKDGDLEQRAQFTLFYGSKYVLSRFDAQDYTGYTHLLGIEARLDLTTWLDVGVAGSIRHAFEGDAIAYAVGPTIGVTPFSNAWISVGYNLVGFRDRDFEASRYTRDGFYIMMRLKFDQQTPQDLGLGSKDK
ncbi:hypothetical protein ACFOMD_15305 [Sphingoaurantiacus capsulatus]|uniref:DUF11 domain-containing protein n=1 Tax=Sphingoaurantiacus capsulatus TaxID=1771310 RepID=A0ABV7XCP4_9SPHN